MGDGDFMPHPSDSTFDCIMIYRLNASTTGVAYAILAIFVLGADAPQPKTTQTPPKAVPTTETDKKNDRKWRSLFDGKSLDGWKEADFPGKGKVTVEDGSIVLGSGMDMTGVNIDGKFPKVNYEVELEAMRADGSDFFCGMTFPAKDEYCSLIIGGWGGGVVGLSSLDGMDASENETTTYREFENGKWYPVRLRVTDKRVTAWIDGKQEVDVDISNRGLDTRIEVEWSKPFGIACWQTTTKLRKLRVRELPPAEVKSVNSDLPTY